MNKLWIRLLRQTMWIVLLLGTMRPAIAQMDQGAIAGTVQDATGAVLANATVHLKNKATGFALNRTTDGSGLYSFSPIKIGVYEISTTFAGFSPVLVSDVAVTASARVNLILTLVPEATTTSVEVSAISPVLQTEESSTGATVTADAIVQTPLLNRNPVFIAQLTPGVVPAEQGSRGANKGDFTANGQRSQQNNYILDGVDNNAILVDVPNGASYVIKSLPESLAEFKVQTSNYNAEFGRAAGAVVNASIKSGSNRLHGAAWEFLRNNALNAKDYFQTAKPEYRQNQFGATLGGPFLKNKLFFFGDVEANRVVFGQNTIYTLPTARMRTGDFSELLNETLTNNSTRTLYVPGTAGTTLQTCNGSTNVICSPNALAEKLLALLPAPNTGVTGQTYNNYNFQGSANDDSLQYDARVDWNPSDKDQAFSRYSSSSQIANFPAPFGDMDGGGWGSIGNITIKGRNFTASENHFFSTSLSNEFRFGYNWMNTIFAQPHANTDYSSQLGLGGVQYETLNGGLPHFNMSNVSSFGTSEYLPTVEYANVAQLLDNVTRTVGRHTVRLGVNFQRLRVQTLQPVASRGQYNYTGKYTQIPGSSSTTGFDVADFIQDQMESAAISNLVTVHNQRWYRSGYVQDDWRLNQKLTLNMGLRYEYFQPQEETSDNQANFDADYSNHSAVFYLPDSKRNLTLPSALKADFTADNVSVAYTSNRALINAQKTNLSPRFGFSYQAPVGLVVHGGFGIFYGGIESVGFSPNLGVNQPFSVDSTVSSGTCTAASCATDGITLATGFETQLAAGLQNMSSVPEFRMYPQDVKTPMTYAYNLSVQRELPHNTVATISYVGTISHHLTSLPDANTPGLLTAGESVQSNRPFTSFGASKYETYGSVSMYNGGQATVEHRMHHGLYFLATYAFSKNLDDAFLPLGATNSSNLRNWRVLGFRYDYGPAFTDTRHRVVFNGQYELPFGKGRRYVNHSQILSPVVGHWNLSLLFRAQTGQPEVVAPNNSPTNGGGNAYAVRRADPYSTNVSNPGTGVSCAAHVHSVGSWFNPCSFTNPPVATSSTDYAAYGPRGKQVVYGPGYNRTDISLTRDFPLYQGVVLNVRADVFNLFNTPALGQPGNTIGSGFGVITSSRFGGSGFSAETPDARVAQFSAKFNF